MTSKDKTTANPAAVEAFRERRARHNLIRAGLLPGLEELFEGAPFFGDSIERDIQAWCDDAMQSPKLSAVLRRAIKSLRDTCSADAIERVRLLLADQHDDDQWRMRVYQACMRVDGTADALAAHIIDTGRYRHDYDAAWCDAVVGGLLRVNRKSMLAYANTGSSLMTTRSRLFIELEVAQTAVEAEEKKAAETPARDPMVLTELLAAVRGADPDDEDFIRAVMEDRAEFWSPRVREIVVVPSFPEGGTGHKKDIQKSWAGMDGQALPVVLRGDVAAHRRALVERWPHATDVIDVVLGDLAPREEVKFRPTLLVGPPGSGKSSLARAICDQIGLPNDLYNLAGMADSSLVGTSAQWSTARECVPLQVIKRSKSASVAVVWDEVEKASIGSQNGSPLDAMLPLLEADQAKRFRDLALEAEVDLSFVSHFGTANTIDGIPAPLRDRMRILVMPEPTWEHVGTLTHQIVDRIARERGIDRRWYPSFDGDEMELIRAAWPGGSIRKLTRIVTAMLATREQHMARC
ncbi:AAA family ATPase [Devosia faecipullorum]|uniref:AAA family ATPase n=1 Tax=Devosia faecipullorum TaxID=2755039 RepID=UPI00187B79A6|nr:AAA family ATPase [Devosia faecipullorum]MBE7732199.1 AAA family ATPase [Devosia faecipullorum]